MRDKVPGIAKYLGKKIDSVALLNDEELFFMFDGGVCIIIYDCGQCCCEHRYMKCDDDLSQFGGAVLKDMELLETDSLKADDGEEHDIVFLRVITDKGDFRCCMHNEHNGYYGGFDPTVKEKI